MKIDVDINPKEHEAVSLTVAYVNDLGKDDLLLCFSRGSTYVFFDFDEDGFCMVSSHDATRTNGTRRFTTPVKARILGSNLGDDVLFANQIIKNTALDMMYFDTHYNRFRALTTSKIKEIVLDIR